MKRIRLIHFHAEEAMERTARLASLGHEVAGDVLRDGASWVKDVRHRRPDGVVIDLSRLPAHGREIGRSMRLSAGLRNTPIVFVGGDPEKVARVRELLPDATYTSWERIGPDLSRTLAAPPEKPHVPPDHPGADSGRPLVEKLGFKPGMAVALVDAPKDVAAALESQAPEGATFRHDLRGRCDLAVCFVTQPETFARRMETLVGRLRLHAFWIAWPKQGSGVASGVNQNDVRAAAQAAGYVDAKICRIDEVWSGLRFVRRKTVPSRRAEDSE